MTRTEIIDWLREEDPIALSQLAVLADDARREAVGDQVQLRGLIEFSNHCSRNCGYCGIRAANGQVKRYRMSSSEILDRARLARDGGLGTVVLQSGDDPGLDPHWLADLIRRIKGETGQAVTLSVGEKSDADLALWREAGADRYLLRFETSNPDLFAAVHPPVTGHSRSRLEQLRSLRELGYEVGSGALVGLPGQTYADLADDILLFGELDLDMIGVGPFLPHPGTPLGQLTEEIAEDQVQPSWELTCTVVALARLVCPRANIPSTTALATLAPESGRVDALRHGANVIMPNFTPRAYRSLYEIYPGKASPAGECRSDLEILKQQLASLNRPAAVGRGDSPSWMSRQTCREGIKESP